MRYRIAFKNNTPHERWAAHAGGNTRDIEIPGNWWSGDWAQQFHFEDLVASLILRDLLSRDDKIRFETAYKVYTDVTQGVGYFGEGTNDDPEPTALAAVG